MDLVFAVAMHFPLVVQAQIYPSRFSCASGFHGIRNGCAPKSPVCEYRTRRGGLECHLVQLWKYKGMSDVRPAVLLSVKTFEAECLPTYTRVRRVYYVSEQPPLKCANQS